MYTVDVPKGDRKYTVVKLMIWEKYKFLHYHLFLHKPVSLSILSFFNDCDFTVATPYSIISKNQWLSWTTLTD